MLTTLPTIAISTIFVTWNACRRERVRRDRDNRPLDRNEAMTENPERPMWVRLNAPFLDIRPRLQQLGQRRLIQPSQVVDERSGAHVRILPNPHRLTTSSRPAVGPRRGHSGSPQ